ncbi:MAG: hypothetical protein KGZ25_08440, partial [Planctomycetes bacterium]|nr:hypothetical protein [Planctomycetota bacterium]
MFRSFPFPATVVFLFFIFPPAHFLDASEPESGNEKVLKQFYEQELLGLNWPETMVTYRVEFGPGQGNSKKLRLLDSEGEGTPLQLWHVKTHEDGSIASARLSFMAELPKNGSYRYRLVRGERDKSDMAARISRLEKYLQIDGEKVGIRLPAAGEHQFSAPLRFGSSQKKMVKLYGRQIENGILPGPLQGFRLLDGRWVGGSYFFASEPEKAPRLQSYQCNLTEKGPLFVEAEIRYSFTNGGYYKFRARILANDPAVRVDEQSDMGRTGSGYSWRLVTSLSTGWKEGGWLPDRTFWKSPQGQVKGHEMHFEDRLSKLGYPVKKYTGRSFGSRSLSFKSSYSKVFNVAAWYPWSRVAHYFALTRSKDVLGALEKVGKSAGLKVEDANEAEVETGIKEALGQDAPPQIPFLGVVPMHAGTWRSAHGSHRQIMLFTHGCGDIDLHWPLLPNHHPNTLLHTGEYDPEKPLTYVRRQWALIGGPLQFHPHLFQFRRYEGYVNLDDYKDWVLDWEPRRPVEYPRLIFDRKDIESFRDKLTEHPAGDWLKTTLYFQENEKRRNKLWGRLTGTSTWNSPVGQAHQAVRNRRDGTPWQSSFRQAQMTGNWAPMADELLSSEQLSDEKRRRLRRYIAALCHSLAEPDFNPRGSMVHLGNPNMPINRTLALAFAASLIPEHPRAQYWLDMVAEFERYKLAMNVAPEGGWSELISYFTASSPHLMQAGMVLGQADGLSEDTARLCTLPARFTLQLLSPKDPRFATRTIPGWGHEGVRFGAHWLVAGALARDDNPDLARALGWAWNEVGRPLKTHHSGNFGRWATVHSDLAPKSEKGGIPDHLRSKWLPGFGAVFRAHAGEPNETYMSYRQGYLTSHCDQNQGDFVLYAKGAPLVTMSLKGYAIHQLESYKKLYEEFGWHSRVRFGRMDSTGGWPGGGPISQVHRNFFSGSLDYARGLGDYGPQRWVRQILFLKGKKASGPNYFVFRDSFTLRNEKKKLQKKWWYIRNPGEKENVRSTDTALHYKSSHGARLDVRFLEPAKIKAESRDVEGKGPLYHGAAYNWRKAHGMKPHHNARFNERMTVTAVGPIEPGKDIVSVLYPRTDGEAAPKYSSLGSGAARIETSESTDYVFVDNEPMGYADADLFFSGIAGAVRIYLGEVHLVIAEGPGTVEYKGTKLRSDVPAIRVVPREKLRERTIEVTGPGHNISFSAAKAKQVPAGVTRFDFEGGFGYEFDAEEPLTWEGDGVRFDGRRGGVIVREEGPVSLVLEKGRSVSYKKL